MSSPLYTVKIYLSIKSIENSKCMYIYTHTDILNFSSASMFPSFAAAQSKEGNMASLSPCISLTMNMYNES